MQQFYCIKKLNNVYAYFTKEIKSILFLAQKTNFKILIVLTIVLYVGITSCGDKNNIVAIDRPIENWAFRSVLDLNPRMLTLALDDKLWVAYHTETGAMYKAWKGSVYLTGAVYNTQHGPQPITVGNGYFENKYKQPWFVLSASGDTVPSTFNYKGHRFNKGQAELMYELTLENTPKPLKIYEKVDVTTTESGQPKLSRTFNTEGVSDGYKIGLKFNLSSVVDESNIKTDGELKITSTTKVPYDNIVSLEIDGALMLKSNEVTSWETTLLNTPTILNKNPSGTAAGTVEEEEINTENIPEGLVLIAKSDCKTCHNKNLQTIGPAYTAIAKKYENNQQNIDMLSKKVKMGGSGVWGEQLMTPHPDLSIEDIGTMVKYIMDLDKDTETKAEATAASKDIMAMAKNATITDKELIPGSITKIYNIPSTTKLMPKISATQKPKFAGIMPNFDNLSGNDFVDLMDFFALTADGYLKIDTAGTYTFHIWSDDGSKVSIEGKLLLNNDGLHGAEYKEVSLSLEKGYYSFHIDFFQGSGGKFLSFNWKKPGDKDFEVIPRTAIYHKSDQLAFLKEYRLPMATVTKIPGDQYALQEVHPSFDLSQARPDNFKPKIGGMDFMADGRLVVSTWDELGGVYIIENSDSGDSTKMTVKRIAQGLAEPLGLKIVNDTIYVLQKQELTRLVDTDKDGIIDEYQTVCNDWKVSANFHEFAFGLVYKDGNFYGTLATAINPGGASTQPQIEDRGKVICINKNTGKHTFIASGLRTPNGIGLGYNDEIFVADNQGDWLPASKIVHVTEGAWFGSHSVDPVGSIGRKEDLPLVWLPQDEIGNSPSTPLAINHGIYKGQMIHSEVTHGGVKRVFVEKVEGKLQGCVFRFIQGLEAGVNRMAWSPKGDLYIGGIGNPGNWGQTGKLNYGLQRLAFNGKPTFEMLAIRARTNGMEIEFTEPLAEGDGWNPAHYEVKQWYYQPTEEYGGPKLDEQTMKVKSATVSDDRKKVFLEMDDLKSNHVVYIRLKKHFISASELPIWAVEAWYTMNNLPENVLGTPKTSPYTFTPNTLSDIEKKAGWISLFDGKSISQWRNFKKKTIGKSWVIDDNAIHLQAIPNKDGGWQAPDGGDIVTNDSYENFEFMLEWKISNCGNSGIMFNVVEEDKYDYVWKTGPEMQVLDNTCHPDSRFVTHRAGDLYDMIESKYPVAKPAGEWNEVRIKSKDRKVEFWLNGIQIVKFDMGSEDWKKLIAGSKFKDMPDFGLAKAGHLSLQDHGDKVWFRNIKIRKI